MAVPAADGPSTWAFLWGKRRWRRQETDLVAAIVLGETSIAARAVDASAGGVLLRVEQSAVAPLLEATGSESLVQLRLGSSEPARAAEVVRMAWLPEEQDAVYVGCRFAEQLTPEEVRVLGLDQLTLTSETGADALPSAEMPQQARQDVTAVFEVHRRATDELLCTGRLLGMHEHFVGIRVEGMEPTGLVADLAHDRVAVRVVDGDAVLWWETAWLTGVRSLDGDAVEVVLQVEGRIGRAVRALFSDR